MRIAIIGWSIASVFVLASTALAQSQPTAHRPTIATRIRAPSAAEAPPQHRRLPRQGLSESITVAYSIGAVFAALGLAAGIYAGVERSSWVGPVVGGASALFALGLLGVAIGMDIGAGRWSGATASTERAARASLSSSILAVYVSSAVALAAGAAVMGGGAAVGMRNVFSGGGGMGGFFAVGGVIAGLGLALLFTAVGMDIAAGSWSGATHLGASVSNEGFLVSASGAF